MSKGPRSEIPINECFFITTLGKTNNNITQILILKENSLACDCHIARDTQQLAVTLITSDTMTIEMANK